MTRETLADFQRIHEKISDLAGAVGLTKYAFDTGTRAGIRQLGNYVRDQTIALLATGRYEAYTSVLGIIVAARYTRKEINAVKQELRSALRNCSIDVHRWTRHQEAILESFQVLLSDLQEQAAFQLDRWKSTGGKSVEAVLHQVRVLHTLICIDAQLTFSTDSGSPASRSSSSVRSLPSCQGLSSTFTRRSQEASSYWMGERQSHHSLSVHSGGARHPSPRSSALPKAFQTSRRNHGPDGVAQDTSASGTYDISCRPVALLTNLLMQGHETSKPFPYAWIFLPLCYGSHWFLLEINMSSRSARVFDSMRSKDRESLWGKVRASTLYLLPRLTGTAQHGITLGKFFEKAFRPRCKVRDRKWSLITKPEASTPTRYISFTVLIQSSTLLRCQFKQTRMIVECILFLP